jgi:hypothetical protein
MWSTKIWNLKTSWKFGAPHGSDATKPFGIWKRLELSTQHFSPFMVRGDEKRFSCGPRKHSALVRYRYQTRVTHVTSASVQFHHMSPIY